MVAIIKIVTSSSRFHIVYPIINFKTFLLMDEHINRSQHLFIVIGHFDLTLICFSMIIDSSSHLMIHLIVRLYKIN